MGTELARRDLTPDQRVAAVLDAQGHSRAEIARIAGTSETTISRWRAEDDYQEELSRLREQNVQALASLTQMYMAEVMAGAIAGIKALRDNLEASDEDGHPMYTTRYEAAVALLNQAGKAATPAAVQGATGGDAPATAQAGAVVIVRGAGAEIVNADPPVAEEA